MHWIPGGKEHTTLQELWKSEDAFATTLIAVLIDHYGTDILDTEPEVIRDYVSGEFNVEPIEANVDKVMALTLGLTTDQFYNSYESFHYICEALNGATVDFSQWSPLEPEYMAWGVAEMLLNDPAEAVKQQPLDPAPPPPESRFGPEVRRYMGVILKENGIYTGFNMLSDAEFVDEPPDTGDPIMFNAYFDRMEDLKKDVNEYVAQRLAAMVFQLKNTPIKNRDNDAWDGFVKRVPSSVFPTTEQAPSSDRQIPIVT